MGGCVSTVRPTPRNELYNNLNESTPSIHCNGECLIDQAPLELQEMILMRAFVMLYVHHYKTAIICAGEKSFSTLARVCFCWWQTLNGWPESSTRLWLKHQIIKQVGGLHRPKTDRPCQLATINTHCHVRGTAQLGDRIYVVCAGYGTVEVFSASDCHWLDRVVVSGLDDPHDLQACVTTKRLFIADVESVWTVRIPTAWARQHVDDVYPMSLSVADARLLVTCRSGHRLTLFGVDGKLLRQVDLDWTMDAWHAAETSNSTFVVCHDGGVSEVDVDGRLTRVCQYDQFEHPCHLAVADGGRLLVADYARVLLLDAGLNVERVLLQPSDDDDNDDDDDYDTGRFSRPLRLNYSPRCHRLLVACRSKFVNVYRWQHHATRSAPTPVSSAVTDSPTSPET